MKKFRTQFDPKYKPFEGEYNDQASKTIPDQSLSIRTLLDNHSRGIFPSMKQYEPAYFGDVPIPVFDDIADAHNYKLELKAKMRKIEQTIKKQKEEAEEAEIKKARERSKRQENVEPTPPEKPTEASKEEKKP